MQTLAMFAIWRHMETDECSLVWYSLSFSCYIMQQRAIMLLQNNELYLLGSVLYFTWSTVARITTVFTDCISLIAPDNGQ